MYVVWDTQLRTDIYVCRVTDRMSCQVDYHVTVRHCVFESMCFCVKK